MFNILNNIENVRMNKTVTQQSCIFKNFDKLRGVQYFIISFLNTANHLNLNKTITKVSKTPTNFELEY